MPSFSPLQKSLAWATHAFTASGMVAGFYAIVFISDRDFVDAFYCLLIALVIDAIDGTFARLFKVKKVLPTVNGTMMDYVVDFANYAIIPAYFLYEAGHLVNGKWEYLLPEDWRWLAVALILIVSVIYYGLDGMVSSDFYFVGFPVMWNAVAFYFYFIFDWGPWFCFGMVIFLAIAHFLPLKFIYPSRSTKFFVPNLVGTFLIIGSSLGLMIAISADAEEGWLRILSMVGMAYFWGVSLYFTFIDKDTRGVK